METTVQFFAYLNVGEWSQNNDNFLSSFSSQWQKFHSAYSLLVFGKYIFTHSLADYINTRWNRFVPFFPLADFLKSFGTIVNVLIFCDIYLKSPPPPKY